MFAPDMSWAQFKPITDWIKVFDNIQINRQVAAQFTEHKPTDDWQALKQQVEYWQTLKQQIARRAQEYQKEFNDITQARLELDKQRSVDATLERACIPPDMIYKANQPWTSPPIPPTKKEGDPDGALVPLPKKEVPERAPLNYPQHDFVAAMYKPWMPVV